MLHWIHCFLILFQRLFYANVLIKQHISYIIANGILSLNFSKFTQISQLMRINVGFQMIWMNSVFCLYHRYKRESEHSIQEMHPHYI